MSREREFIERLAAFAHDPAARGLADDVAVVPMGEWDIVLTHDMIVAGGHFLADDAPEDVAWKLVAVNLSDLAAKGAEPIGLLVGYPLADEPGWDMRFADGLAAATAALGVPLLGGDTVAVPPGAVRQLGATAVGRVPRGSAPSRAGAQPDDLLVVTGVIGAAGLGLAAARSGGPARTEWLHAYRRPQPRLAAGRWLRTCVHAMADVSDGLLIDAARMARASGVGVEVALDRVPLAAGAPAAERDRLAAATAGDDYELIAALPQGLTLSQPEAAYVTSIGRFRAGAGLALTWAGEPIALPDRLGFEHGER